MRMVRALVALAVLGAGASALPHAAAAPPPSGEFLALTYNVAGLPQGMSSSDPANNSPRISPLLNDYDLVLLQEDWADPVEQTELFFHDEIVSEANHPYRSEPAPPPMGTDTRRLPSGPTLIADGLNQLSDFPFGTLHREMWKVCFGEFHVAVVATILDAAGLDGPIKDAGLGDAINDGAADCGAQKGFTMARTTLADGVEVDVYNLHGEAGSSPPDRAASAADFIQLAEYVNANSAGRAVIIGGDTNLHTCDPSTESCSGKPDRPGDRAVWKKFQADTGVSDVCSVPDLCADAGEIDKFAFRSGGGVRLTPRTHNFESAKFSHDGKPLSDHEPLAVTFAWRAEKSGKGRPRSS